MENSLEKQFSHPNFNKISTDKNKVKLLCIYILKIFK